MDAEELGLSEGLHFAGMNTHVKVPTASEAHCPDKILNKGRFWTGRIMHSHRLILTN